MNSNSDGTSYGARCCAAQALQLVGQHVVIRAADVGDDDRDHLLGMHGIRAADHRRVGNAARAS